jgi:beta-galactosidase
VWEADRAYSRGSWGYIGGEGRLRHHRIYGTNDHPLYQYERLGVQRYHFDVPTGAYEVRLRFTEQEFTEGGRRTFNVQVNGQPVFDALDLAGMYGRYVAVERRVMTRTSGDMGITVELLPITGLTTISGIALHRR